MGNNNFLTFRLKKILEKHLTIRDDSIIFVVAIANWIIKWQ